jgi:hypothetical protein
MANNDSVKPDKVFRTAESGAHINELFRLAGEFRIALERVKPTDLMQATEEPDSHCVFILRMASAGYKAISNEMDSIANLLQSRLERGQ